MVKQSEWNEHEELKDQNQYVDYNAVLQVVDQELSKYHVSNPLDTETKSFLSLVFRPLGTKEICLLLFSLELE